MKQLLSLACAVALLLGAVACTAPPPVSKPHEPSVDSSSSSTGSHIITDDAILRELWEVYLASSPTLLNERVEDLSTLTASETTTAAITVWSRSNSIADLPTVEMPREINEYNNVETVHYWTLEQATEQVEHTFGMTIDDPAAYFGGMQYSNSSGPYYLPEQQYIAFFAEGPWERQNEYGEPAWGYMIEQAVDNGDGTITVTLVREDDYINKPSDRAIFVLGRHDDGSYYYKTAVNEYYNNHVANLQGSYREVDIAGVGAGLGLSAMKLLWQDGDSVVISNEAGRKKQHSETLITQLLRVNTKTAKLENIVDIETPLLRQENNYLNIYGTADGIVVSSRYGVQLYDLKTLERVSDLPLPASLVAKMVEPVRETTPDGHAVDKEFLEEFVVAADGSSYYYSNHEGLFWVDATTDNAVLLSPSSVLQEGPIKGIISTPRGLTPVNGGSGVAYVLYGYEWLSSVGFSDALGKNSLTQDTASASFGDSGMLTLNVTDSSQMVVSYFDYDTATTRTATIEPHDIDSSSYSLVNPIDFARPSSKYILLGTMITPDGADKPKAVLMRASLEDMVFERLDFNIAVDYHVVGITDMGTALVAYSYNTGEYGLLLID